MSAYTVFMPSLQLMVAVRSLNVNALELVKLSTRIDMSFEGNPSLTLKRMAQSQESYNHSLNLDFSIISNGQ